MKSFVLTILILLCIFLAFVYVLVNTPFLMNTMVPQFINDHAQSFSIQEFKCKRQKSRLPNILSMYDVMMKVKVGENFFDIKAKELTVHNFLEFMQKRELLRVSSSGLDVKGKNLSIEGGKTKTVVGLSEWKVRFIEGAAFSQDLWIGPYHSQKISAHLKSNPQKIEIFEIEGDIYGGIAKGQITFDHKPHFSYVVWSEFSGLDTKKMENIYPDFFKDMTGMFDGSIRVVGSEQVDIFTIICQGRKGMAISPNVFLRMKGAFDDEEEKELRQLADSGAFLKAEHALLHVQNSRNQDIMFVFDIEEMANHFRLKGQFPLSWKQGFESFLFPLVNK
jgi:hypothetical protein